MKARSRHRTSSSHPGYIGPLPPRIWALLDICWHHGVAVSSNMAREASTEIGLAASMGWISTVSLDGGSYGRVWHITAEGVSAYSHKDMLT